MRASALVWVVCCVACGGRTAGDWDYTNAQGGSGDTGGSKAAGASFVIMGGSGASTSATGWTGSGGTKSGFGGAVTVSTGGNGVKVSTGGNGTKVATGGNSAKAGTGGTTPSATGGSGAKIATGGTTSSSTGGKGAGGATTGATGGKGGGATTSATGGQGGIGGSGGTTAIATGGSSSSGGTGGAAGSSGTVVTSCNDTFPFLGTWEGDILDFYFDPTEALKLELSEDTSGVITGKVTWGSGAPPPAPQGADIPYPPGYWEQQNGMHFTTAAPDPWPGFAYTIVRGAGCDTTFRFGVSTSELWQDWCALQTPIDSGSFGWGCTLLGGSGSSDGTSCTIYGPNGSQTYPLWKCEACGSFGGGGGVCSCDQNGCFASTTVTETFDLAYSVSGGTEILSGPDPNCGDCTVRLARTSN